MGELLATHQITGQIWLETDLLRAVQQRLGITPKKAPSKNGRRSSRRHKNLAETSGINNVENTLPAIEGVELNNPQREKGQKL
eukprot:6748636-Ditylum_brightwellii.AAC.1